MRGIETYFYLTGRRWGRKLDLARVKSALVVRLDEIGDVVLTSPLLRELRRNLPAAWITLLVKPAARNLVERCPHVNEVLAFNSNAPEPQREALRFARGRLWRRRFDLALLPRWDIDYYHSAFLAYASGARWRVGYGAGVSEHKERINAGMDQWLTHRLDDRTLRHEVERNLAVLRFVGGEVADERLELWLGAEDEAFAAEILGRAGLRPDESLVGLGPSGGSTVLKQWPPERFVELGRWLRDQHRARVLLVGGPGEEALGREIEGALGAAAINTVGPITLRQMAALVKRCRLYLGNDAGPMHIAAATGVPVVGLFGSSCHHRFGPWGEGHTLLWSALPCSPCLSADHYARCEQCIFDRPECMWEIRAAQVQAAVAAQLSPEMARR